MDNNGPQQQHQKQRTWNSSTSNSYYFNTKSSPIDFSVSVLGAKDNEKSSTHSSINNGGSYMLINSGKEAVMETPPPMITRLPSIKLNKPAAAAASMTNSTSVPEFRKRVSHSFSRSINNETKATTPPPLLHPKATTMMTNASSSANVNNENHFIDLEFPPNKKSIENRNKHAQSFSFLNLIHSLGMKRAKCWLRPNELNRASEETYLPISLYSSSSSRDVLQGGIGSCWFISALSVIAERPELLSNILITKSYNASGLHQIRLCKRGEWVTVNIDDYLPCDRKGKVIFAYARYRQLWVSFIEKALAKLYGGYKAIVSGACVEGLQTLTGEPCEIIYLDQAEKNLNNSTYDYKANSENVDNPWHLWRRLIFAKSAGYLMTTLCYKDHLRYFDMHRVGLFKRHIYSVLDVREFSHNGNPWGKKEWKGQWSNHWSHWPEHIKAELAPNVGAKNDGCFWISYQDLLKYFYDISICKIRSDWFESRHCSNFFYNYLDGAHVFVLQVTGGESTRGSASSNAAAIANQFEIELFATGRRFQEFDRNADPDIDLCLCVCRVDDPQTGKGLRCVAFEHNVEYFINLSARLEPGSYYVFATSIRAVANLGVPTGVASPDYHSYNLVIHGQSRFVLNQAVLPPELVADVFYAVARFSDKIRYELNGNLRTLIIPGSCTHAIIVENLSASQFIRVNVDLSQSKNLESTRQAARTCDVLGPGTRQLVAYLTPVNYRKGFVIGYKIESSLLLSSSSSSGAVTGAASSTSSSSSPSSTVHVSDDSPNTSVTLSSVPSPSNQPHVPYCFAGLHGIRSASSTI